MATVDPGLENMRRLHEKLCRQASLFDDPDTYLAGVKDALAAAMDLPAARPEPVDTTLTTVMLGHHAVEFYEDDEFLVASVVEFLAPALTAGEVAIVVATGDHRDKFEAALRAEGLDVSAAHEHARLVTLDAAQTLAAFVIDGTPDPVRFRTALGGLIDGAAGSGRGVRIYGEMVALLWQEGNILAAVALEDLWNELSRSHHFSLLCGYPMAAFNREESTAAFRTMCQQHSAVIPSESYSKLSDPDDRLRTVALLQQEASAGSYERIALRRKQNELEAALDRLRQLERRIEFVVMMVQDLATMVDGLRTPATIISEFLGLLRDNWSELDEAEIQQFLTKALKNGEQIEQLVGDLLLTLRFSDLLLE